jgi:hypothetical protein
MRLPKPAMAVMLAAVTMANPAVRAEDVAAQLEAAPIVRLSGRDITGCGVGLTARYRGGVMIAELVLADDAGGRAFTLTVRHDPVQTLQSASLMTGGLDTSTLFGPPVQNADGSISMRGALPGLPGSEFMRSLMVEGVGLVVEWPSTTRYRWAAALEGPMRQTVRAAYLNCAGDLERP